jgi:hypothetical protein
MMKLFSFLLLLTLNIQCDPSTTSDPVEDQQDLAYLISTDRSGLKCWNWNEIMIPVYTWPGGTAFGDGLFVDTAFDPEGISIVGKQVRFYIDPLIPETPENAPSSYNYRSEIHTAPWPINHPLGTEQWIGWEYTFGDNYVIDTSSPITVFQNHPGINGLSPQIEIEIAALNDPAPAQGGEIQVVNAASSDRFVYPVKPMAGDKLEVVIHVIYGLGTDGLLQVWLNDHLFYNKKTATVYQDQPWGGNNKWGVYHHTFMNSTEHVSSSLNLGAGRVELFMSPLKLLTRTPDHAEYGIDAYDLVRPKD